MFFFNVQQSLLTKLHSLIYTWFETSSFCNHVSHVVFLFYVAHKTRNYTEVKFHSVL